MTALGSTLAMFSLARLSRLAPYKHANPRVSTRRDARPLRVVVNFRAATARAAAADIQPRIGFIGAGSMAEAMARMDGLELTDIGIPPQQEGANRPRMTSRGMPLFND